MDREVRTRNLPPEEIRSESLWQEVDWFRGALAENGIQIAPSSALSRAVEAIEYLRTGAARGLPFPTFETVQAAVGVIFLVRALRRLERTNPTAVKKRWHFFRGSEVNLAAPAPPTKKPQTRDRIWELFVASILERVAEGVSLADHENPDVSCVVRGVRWGVECKVLHTPDPGNARNELIRKVRQIEGSPVAKGVIAVDLTNLLKPAIGVGNDASESVHAQLEQWRDQVLVPAQINPRWSSTSKARVVLLFAQAVVVAAERIELVAGTIFWAPHRLEPDATAFANRLTLGYRKCLADS